MEKRKIIGKGEQSQKERVTHKNSKGGENHKTAKEKALNKSK